MVHLQGELVARTVADLRNKLAGAPGQEAVLFDLTNVDFIDAIGVGALVGAIRRVHERGGRVAIAVPDSRRGITGALRACGIDRLVHVADSRAQALALIQSRSEEIVT